MQAWNNFLLLQEIEMGFDTVRKWLKPLKVLRFDACNLYLEANDSFQILWFEEHIRKKVVSKLRNNNNRVIKVHLSLANQKPPTPRPVTKKEDEQKRALGAFQVAFDEIDPYCTLDHFIPSVSSQLPYSIIQEMADKKPITLNPIYLYGQSGTGKTHLLMAAAHLLRSQGLKVIYSRTDKFTEHVVQAIRNGEMSQFRQAYRNVDVLIVDDVHILSRKAATQEEFFHTFNTLHLANKLIILSANCAPNELEYVEPRLVSRFEWGIALPMEHPSKEIITKIILSKATALKSVFNPKIIEFLVETFPSSCKKAIRALEALILRTHLNPNTAHQTLTMLTVPMARNFLNDLIQEEEKSAINPNAIIKTIAGLFGIRPEDILGKAKSRDCVLPRQIAMYICRHELKIPFTKIGDLFTRDHSTVMSSVKLVQRGLDRADVDITEPYHNTLKQLRSLR